MRTFGKLGSVVAVVVALVIGSAAPASATDHPVETTAGTLNTVLGSFPLVRGEGPCPQKPSTRVFTTDASGTWTLGGVFSVQFELPAASGNWYQADRTILPGSGGAWTGAGPTHPITGVIGIQQRVYQLQLAGGPLDCTKSNQRCIITGVFTIQTGSYAGAVSLPTTTVGDQLTFNATTTGPLATSACTPPWNSIGGTNASVTGVTMTLV